MHRHHIARYQHSHVFLATTRQAERRTRMVVALTVFTMLAEIIAGTWFHSLVLLADGWHMSTDPAALGWRWLDPLAAAIRTAIERDGDTRISDLYLWRVGARHYACIVALIASQPKPPAYYRALLARHPELVHVTLELARCEDACA